MLFRKRFNILVLALLLLTVGVYAEPGQAEFDAVVGISYNASMKHPQSFGTGFLITPGGHIMTAAHVIREDMTPPIVLFKGEAYTSTILAIDRQFDVAILDIEVKFAPIIEPEKKAPTIFGIPLGKPQEYGHLALNQMVYILGYPLNSQTFLNRPVLSQGEFLGYAIETSGMKINAPLLGGMSGGPVLDKYNRVVGVVSRIFVENDMRMYSVSTDYSLAIKILERKAGRDLDERL